MFIVYVIVAVVAAAANAYAAANDFIRPEWLLADTTKLGVSESSLPIVGALKAAGALGLLVGIGIPFIGKIAAAGLLMFFAAAIITHLRAHDHSFGLAIGFLLLAGLPSCSDFTPEGP